MFLTSPTRPSATTRYRIPIVETTLKLHDILVRFADSGSAVVSAFAKLLQTIQDDGDTAAAQLAASQGIGAFRQSVQRGSRDVQSLQSLYQQVSRLRIHEPLDVC